MTAGAGVGAQLTKDLRAQVTELERDLLARAQEVPEFADALKTEYDAARAAERTGMGITEWRAGRVTQAAAAWVLATVFVRYCEDNGLIGPAFLAGPGERLQEAEERHEQFFREHPNRNDRDWLLAAIGHLSDAHPTAAGPVRPAAQPAVGADALVRGGHGADRVLAAPRRQRRPALRPSTAGTPASSATSTRTSPSRPARPTRCCRPRSSSRSSSSTSP